MALLHETEAAILTAATTRLPSLLRPRYAMSQATDEPIKVYWQPGWTSCLRT